jgi:transposase
LRSIARRIDALDDEIAVLDRQLERLVRAAAPRTTQLLGISTGHAGQLLVTAGQNIDSRPPDACDVRAPRREVLPSR